MKRVRRRLRVKQVRVERNKLMEHRRLLSQKAEVVVVAVVRVKEVEPLHHHLDGTLGRGPQGQFPL